MTKDKLAEMIQKGFIKVDEKLDDMKKDIAALVRHTANVVQREEFDKLEGRVEIMEKIK